MSPHARDSINNVLAFLGAYILMGKRQIINKQDSASKMSDDAEKQFVGTKNTWESELLYRGWSGEQALRRWKARAEGL